MAKIKSSIFATTALVAFAGAAAADVTLSGSAEMGIAGGDNNAATTFFQSVDVRFRMSGETDNGLSFGALVDLEDVIDSSNATTASDLVDDAGTFADYTVFISGDFGTLTMGDTDGALDWAVQEANLNNAGSIADNETGHAGFNGNGDFDGIGAFNGQVLRYNYSIAGFGVAVSAETARGAAGGDINDSVNYGIGFNYGGSFGGGSYKFGLGYQAADDINDAAATDTGYSATAASAQVSLDAGFSAVVSYTMIDMDGANMDGEHMGVGISYSMDAITLHANYGEFDWETASTTQDSTGYGFAAKYDLGGGLSAHLGYGNSDFGTVNADTTLGTDNSTWSLGLAMSF